MCILLRFNSCAPHATYDDLLSATRIPADEFKRHLTSLLMPKCRILLRRSARKAKAKAKAVAEDGVGDGGATEKEKEKRGQPSVESGDAFRVNAKFKSKLLRVRVPLLSSQQRRVLLPARVAQVRKLRGCTAQLHGTPARVAAVLPLAASVT